MVLRDAELERELDPMRVRPAAVVGVILVLGLVGWLAWRSFSGGADAGATASAQPAGPVASAPRRMVFRRDAPRAAPVPASAPVVVPPGHVEVCGLGVVPEKDLQRAPLEDEMRARLARARDRLVGTLAARGDDTSRATALLLAMVDGELGEGAAGTRTAAGPHRTELVRLALGTRSAAAYAMALGACRWGSVQDQAAATAAAASGLPAPSPQVPPASCGLLSVDQLARLDADDGSVWLAVAAAANDRRDRDATLDALHRFTTTQRMSPAWGALPQRVLDAAPPDVGPFEAFQLANDLFGFELGSQTPLMAVTQSCTETAVRDANRAQLCDGVARTLVERGATMMDLAVGTAVGKRVGWPAERVTALEQERRALMNVSMQRLPQLMKSSCDGLRANADYTRLLGAKGERAALHAQLDASGRSVAEWATPAASAPAGTASGVAAPGR